MPSLKLLHITGDPQSHSGIAQFGVQLRQALRAAGVVVVEHLVAADAACSGHEIKEFAREAHRQAAAADLTLVELGARTVHEFQAARLIGADRAQTLYLTAHDPPWLVRSPFMTRSTRNHRWVRIALGIALARQTARLERELLNRADGVFTLSRDGLEALSAQVPGGLRTRGVVLPYGPPAREADDEHLDADRAPGLTVGFFGHWYAGKGLPTLIAALGLAAHDRLPIHARLYGDSWPPDRAGAAFRESIQALIRRSPARALIVTPGFLAEDHLAAELRRCDVVVLDYERGRATRRLKSSSAALHDVLSTGTPVVASGVRALGEFVDDGRNGLLIEPDDPQTLVAVLRRLRDAPELRERLQRGARASARTRSPEAAARTVMEMHLRRRGAGGRGVVPASASAVV